MPHQSAPVTVLLAGGEPGWRREVRRAVDADPGSTVVGEARHERELMAMLSRLRPAVLLLDLAAAGGVGLVERVMAQQAVPIVAVVPVDGAPGLGVAALAAGAVDVVSELSAPQLRQAAGALQERVRLAARVRVISHPRGRLRLTSQAAWAASASASASAARPALQPVSAAQGAPVTAASPGIGGAPGGSDWAATGMRPADRHPVHLVVIGASTGGPPALVRVLRAVPVGTETAVLVVQHMAEGFVEGLVSWLDQQLLLPVGLARAGERLRPGRVAVAPGALNTVVDAGLRIRYEVPPPLQFHTPGVDAAMLSLLRPAGLRVLGVLLTGMGRDGAQGMVALRAAGQPTLGQDEASSAVYGMPMVAHELGGVGTQLPLAAIGPAVASWCRPSVPAVGALALRAGDDPAGVA